MKKLSIREFKLSRKGFGSLRANGMLMYMPQQKDTDNGVVAIIERNNRKVGRVELVFDGKYSKEQRKQFVETQKELRQETELDMGRERILIGRGKVEIIGFEPVEGACFLGVSGTLNPVLYFVPQRHEMLPDADDCF